MFLLCCCLNMYMSNNHKHSVKRFRNFLSESTSKDSSVVNFQIGFEGSIPSEYESEELAIEIAEWIINAVRLDDGSISVSAIWSGRDIVGWDFEVTTPDAKAAALLAAYLDSGSISPLTEALTRREGTSCFVLLVESTPRFTVRVPLRRFTDKRQ